MADDPAVCLANWYQFAPGELVHNRAVESRMVLWCRRGRGTVEVDGAPVALPPGGFAVLPWGHGVRYLADRRAPFLVGGAHLVARCGAWQPRVAHRPGDPLARHPDRSDAADLPRGVQTGQLADHPALAALVEHCAESWARRWADEPEGRAQGALLLAELRLLAAAPAPDALPRELARVIEAVRRNPQLPWNAAELARAAGCGVAWLARLFRRHLRSSPRRWVEAQRLERARALLVDRGRPVAEIAATVGIPDPFRFSKRFRALYGVSPRQMRRDAW